MISSLLKGERLTISALDSASLALSLNVSTEFLMGLTQEFLPNEAIGHAMVDLLEAVKNLPASKQHNLLFIANAYAESNAPSDDMMETVMDAVAELRGEEGVNELLYLLERLIPSNNASGQHAR